MNAAATPRPTKKLIRGMVPPELTAPATCPFGRKFVRYARPVTVAARPVATKPPAPAASTAPVRPAGLNRLKTRNSPAR